MRDLCESMKLTDRAPWLKVDLVLLSATMLFTDLLPVVWGVHFKLSEILRMRISLINFVLAATCLGLLRIGIGITKVSKSGAHANLRGQIAQLVFRVTTCTGIASMVLWVRHPGRITSETVLTFWSVALLLLLLSRVMFAGFCTFVRPAFRRDRKIIIVGAGWRGQKLAQELDRHPRWRYRLLGFVDSEPSQPLSGPLLGSTQDLGALLMRQVVDEVIITLPVKSKYDEIQTAIEACERVGVQSKYSTDLFSTQVTKRRSVEDSDASSVVLHMVHNDHHHILKRTFDLAAAVLGLVLLSPLLLLVALAIKLTSKGPVLFRQQRYGLNRRTFTMYKFRSMVADAELRQRDLEHLNETNGPAFKIRMDPRITPIGRLIRKSSIDELPQLLNVICGHMSLVGPRPLPMRDVSLFSEASLMRRFSVKPGLTGLWQVSGRSNTSFANWMKLDLEYIDRWTFLLDVQILMKTIPAVLKGSGAA